MILGDDPNPRRVRREASIDGVIFHVQRLTPELAKSAVWTRALGIGGPVAVIAYLCGGGGFSGLWAAVVCAIAAVGAWLAYGLVLAPMRAAAAPIDSLTIDRTGVEWRGSRWPWANVASVEVEPYPFVNRSHVYCLEIRSVHGDILRAAPGVDSDELGQVCDVVREQRRRAQLTDPGPEVDSDALEALDSLLGRGRSD